MCEGDKASPTPMDSPPSRRALPERMPSAKLLGAAGELIIEHDGREYRLRLTRQGKLILTA